MLAASVFPLAPSKTSSATGNAPGSRGGLIAWFIANPVAANLLMVVLLVGGALSALNLRSQVFPTISPGTVVVTVPYPGATPAEVNKELQARVLEGAEPVTCRPADLLEPGDHALDLRRRGDAGRREGSAAECQDGAWRHP